MGVVRRLQGGSKGFREKLSVYFLSLALGNCTTILLHIFSVLAGFCLQVSRGEDKLFPVLMKFCFSHGLLIISVASMALFKKKSPYKTTISSTRSSVRIMHTVWKPSPE